MSSILEYVVVTRELTRAGSPGDLRSKFGCGFRYTSLCAATSPPRVQVTSALPAGAAGDDRCKARLPHADDAAFCNVPLGRRPTTLVVYFLRKVDAVARNGTDARSHRPFYLTTYLHTDTATDLHTVVPVGRVRTSLPGITKVQLASADLDKCPDSSLGAALHFFDLVTPRPQRWARG